MSNLDKRISALESKAALDVADRVDTIIICPLTADGEKREVHRLGDMRGPQSWERLEGEAEQAFIDRASREAHRVCDHISLLMG